MGLKEKLEDAAIKNIAGIQFEYFCDVLRRSSLLETVASRKKSINYLIEKGWRKKNGKLILPNAFYNLIKNECPDIKDELLPWKVAIKMQYTKEMYDNL